MTARRIALVVCAIAVAGSGCAGSKLKARTGSIRDMAATAKENGAMRCAPRELAMAESHLDFAEQELSEGRYYQARGELQIAEANARRALRKSPKDRCAPKQELVVTVEDSDGDGILDPDDECPNDPEDKDGFQDSDGCPDNDNDNDGILDVDDNCPNDPEDKDGFEDDDGCPDCDNDGDGVLECPTVVDKCPDQPAPDTADGCPQKYKLVVVTESKIEIKQTVYFATNKSVIKRVSFPLLNEVAQALQDNPTIEVRIEGHTDSRGSDKHNLKLSDDRANSVREYLIGQGVDGGRMTSTGFGEDVPIADNRTKDGRAQNRRVEFVITNR
jgi:outer membrane protein OmpA-like peptidoglycan-associated protein